MHQIDRRLGHDRRCGDGARQHGALVLAPAHHQKAALGEADLAQHVIEIGPRELPVDPFEVGVAAHALGQRRVGQHQVHRRRLFVERGLADDLRQHAAVEAELLGLLLRDAAPHLVGDGVDLVAVLVLEAVGSDRHRTDLGDPGITEAQEVVRDAPHREGEHEEREQSLGQPA